MMELFKDAFGINHWHVMHESIPIFFVAEAQIFTVGLWSVR